MHMHSMHLYVTEIGRKQLAYCHEFCNLIGCQLLSITIIDSV